MKKHYWLVVIQSETETYNIYVDALLKFVNRKMLDQSIDVVKIQHNRREAIVTSVHYLGEMTQEEWEE